MFNEISFISRITFHLHELIFLDVFFWYYIYVQVICDRLQDVPQCSGIAEGCFGESWLSGFHAYIIENSTDALL